MTTYSFPAGRYSNTDTAFIKAYIDQEVAGVLDLAPETLNTLNELAAAINDDPAFYATVAAQVTELNTDVTDLVTALGVSENDSDVGTFTSPTLPDGVTLKAVLEAFALAYENTKSSLETADSTLSGRIDVLEADPTTATALAALQADVDTNETDSDAAEAALSGRLDVLEADPTTATALAAGDAATLSSANAYTDGEITTLINGAPGVLDTLKELSDSLGGDADFVTTINASIAAVQADVDTNESDSDSADSALSGRLDVLEADPTTATALAAVQADVDANETASDNAEAALSARLDTLEADPTTATALAAVQADVDANETASDNAEAALSGRLDTLEADPTTQTYVDGINTALDARLDTLEADPTTATALTNGLALKADLTGATFTGDVIVDEGDGPTIKLETSQDGNAGIVINGSSGVYAYIDTTNGFGNDNLQVYSANFWVRAINGGTGNVIIDGQLTAGGFVNAANDVDAAAGGVPLNGLYHHNGDMKIRVS